MSSSSFKTPVDTGTSKSLREFTVGSSNDDFDEPSVNPHYIAPVAPVATERRELSAAEREELQRLRKQSYEGGVRIEDYSKKRLEILVNIGRLVKIVELEGISFSLRTLKAKETKEATLPIFKTANDFEARHELRRQSLARSIFEIDGQSVELTLGGNSLDLKLELVDGMEEVLVEKLYNNFQELTTESQNKYTLKTEQEVKEVVDDIKK